MTGYAGIRVHPCLSTNKNVEAQLSGNKIFITQQGLFVVLCICQDGLLDRTSGKRFLENLMGKKRYTCLLGGFNPITQKCVSNCFISP